jgi:hypothetical protein
MVRGLELFRDRFEDFPACYVLIGGAASQLAMDEEGLEFRATKDLDIVLCIEALDSQFVEAFWRFVRDGGYERWERSTGPRRYYRFQSPSAEAYPAMLELFSRKPDGTVVPDDVALTPIPVDADISSLSAILLDDTYYAWVMAGRRDLAGLQAVGVEHLIPLKARAYLDLSARRDRGESVDLRNVKKHRSDVVRLLQALPAMRLEGVPEVVRRDVANFVNAFGMTAADLKNIRVVFRTPDAVVEMLTKVYGLDA